MTGTCGRCDSATGPGGPPCSTRCAPGCRACQVTGSTAGLHLVAHLGDGVDAADVVTAAAARGLRLVDLGAYRVDRREPADCLVLGYGNLADGAVDDAVVMLAASVAEQSPHDSGPPR
jgi:GntR family transcriptional regulator/MocR family aminotransferase